MALVIIQISLTHSLTQSSCDILREELGGSQMAGLGLWVLILVFSSLPLVLGSPMQNRWGWLYNNGRELDRERKVNIIAMMLQTAGNVAATSAFVRVCDNTTRKWWNHWLTTGTFEKQKEKPGPKPRLPKLGNPLPRTAF